MNKYRDELSMNISKNLKRLIYESGKTSADVAKDLDVSKSAMSMWLSGKRIPRLDVIKKMAAYFGCRPSDIMADKTADERLVDEIMVMIEKMDMHERLMMYERALTLLEQRRFKED